MPLSLKMRPSIDDKLLMGDATLALFLIKVLNIMSLPRSSIKLTYLWAEHTCPSAVIELHVNAAKQVQNISDYFVKGSRLIMVPLFGCDDEIRDTEATHNSHRHRQI